MTTVLRNGGYNSQSGFVDHSKRNFGVWRIIYVDGQKIYQGTVSIRNDTYTELADTKKDLAIKLDKLFKLYW